MTDREPLPSLTIGYKESDSNALEGFISEAIAMYPEKWKLIEQATKLTWAVYG